jgi:hypothetical protein
MIRRFINLFRRRRRLVFGADTHGMVRRQRIQTEGPGLEIIEDTQGTTINLDLQTVYEAGHKASEWDHPWRLNHIVPGTACKVLGGRINTGRGAINVKEESSTVPTMGEHFWWVYIYYPNNKSDPVVAEIRDDSSLPDDDYEVDDFPVSGTPCDPVTLTGYCETIIPIARSKDGKVTQLMFQDLNIQRGLTVAVKHVLQHYWDGGTLKNVTITETYVNGVLREVTDPTCEEVFNTDDCPEGN